MIKKNNTDSTRFVHFFAIDAFICFYWEAYSNNYLHLGNTQYHLGRLLFDIHYFARTNNIMLRG